MDDASERRPVALVFGGSRGIGAAIASDGYRVALTYVSSPDKAEEIVRAIRGKGGDASAILADSADPAAIRAAVPGVWSKAATSRSSNDPVTRRASSFFRSAGW